VYVKLCFKLRNTSTKLLYMLKRAFGEKTEYKWSTLFILNVKSVNHQNTQTHMLWTNISMQMFYIAEGKTCSWKNPRCGTLEIDLTTKTKLLFTPHDLGRNFLANNGINVGPHQLYSQESTILWLYSFPETQADTQGRRFHDISITKEQMQATPTEFSIAGVKLYEGWLISKVFNCMK
jgi:hypothetical protein